MSVRASALLLFNRRSWSALSAAMLAGCPQMLEDHFEIQDASVPISNAGGAGGAHDDDAGPEQGGRAGSGISGTGGFGGSSGGGSAGSAGASQVGPDDAGISDAAHDDGDGSSGAGAGVGGGGGQGGSEEPPPDPLGVLKQAIAHRYSFNGTGTALVDSVGGENGTFIGGTLSGDGTMVLSGSGSYGDLPNNLISVHESVTLEVWLVWSGTTDHQRIFDFGISSTGVENQQGSNGTHLYLTPKAPGTPGNMVLSYRGSGTTSLSTTPLTKDTVQHLAAVIDGATHTMSIYRNGALGAFRDHAQELSQIQDLNSWLGRSQISGDPNFQGEFREFRIYAAALDAAAILASFNAGEDADVNPD